jgi:hypothetical protein
MPKGSPIQLTFYGPEDEVIRTYSRSIITTRFLERAIDLTDQLERGENTKDTLNAIDQLIVDFFGDAFTIDECKDHSDFTEKVTVIYSIISRAGELSAASGLNPTTPPGKKTRRKRAKPKPKTKTGS